MERIHISGFKGETITIRIPSAKLNNVKISELRSLIRDRTGVGVEHQRILYANKELANESCGHIRTLSYYGIRGGATIILVMRLHGGADIGLNPLKFADVTSKDKFIPLEFASSGPEWRRVGPGLSFTGICKQFGCAAINDIVLVNKGFYESTGGQCALNSEIFNLECPMCQTKLNKKEVRGVGIYKCQLTVKFLQEGHRCEGSYEFVSKDKYQYAGCKNEEDKIPYEYITLIVKKR